LSQAPGILPAFGRYDCPSVLFGFSIERAPKLLDTSSTTSSPSGPLKQGRHYWAPPPYRARLLCSCAVRRQSQLGHGGSRRGSPVWSGAKGMDFDHWSLGLWCIYPTDSIV